MGFGIRKMKKMLEEERESFELKTVPLIYKVNPHLITSELLQKYIESNFDEGTREFIHKYCKPENGCFSCLTNTLRIFLSVTDTNAILSRGQMHVLSENQLKNLFEDILFNENNNNEINRIESNINNNKNFEKSQQNTKKLRIFDIGAGDGTVTNNLAKTFCQPPQNFSNNDKKYKERVLTSEISTHMQRRLRKEGFPCLASINTTRNFLEEEIYKNYPSLHPYNPNLDPLFDIVSCLNVIDRCDTPITLLKNIRKLILPKYYKEGDKIDNFGYLLLAVVLPWSAFVENGSKQAIPSEPLPEFGDHVIWRSPSYLQNFNHSLYDPKFYDDYHNNEIYNFYNNPDEYYRNLNLNNNLNNNLINLKNIDNDNDNIIIKDNNNNDEIIDHVDNMENLDQLINNRKNNARNIISNRNNKIKQNNNNNNNNYDNKNNNKKKKKAGIKCACCCTFEEAVEWLVANLLDKIGLEVVRWTRVPYISAGDIHSPYYTLNNAVFVLKPSFMLEDDLNE